jgi:hypothetical protein
MGDKFRAENQNEFFALELLSMKSYRLDNSVVLGNAKD